ncbi:MAG: PAC2 family protein [Candidatus Nanoarchaeia archaeon]
MGQVEETGKKRAGVDMMHNIRKIEDVKIKNPILIEGLPGIGNVGKIAVDFMIDALKPKKIYEIHSDGFPHAVFVNEQNLVDLPTIRIYHKRIKNKDFLFLAGDVQPIDEPSCYEFCNKILDLVQGFKVKEVITLGGIGLQKIPENPQVYCTGNSKKIIDKYKSQGLNCNIYGIVGPIMGVSGLLVGLAKYRDIPSIAILAETFGHPTYVGMKGAREILKILNKKLELGLNLNQLEREIAQVDKDIKTKTEEIKKQKTLTKKTGKKPDISYIG